MNWYDQLVNIGWLAFWLYWVIAAVKAKQDVRVNRLNSRWPRLFVTLVLIVVLFAPIFKTINMSHITQAHTQLIKLTGLAIFYAGLGLAVWARRHLGDNWGMPMATKKNPRLITSGPYRVVRHPIYSGLLLAILGTALVKNYAWLFILVLTLVFAVYSSVNEEKLLTKQFPKTYPAYKNRTKMLIPYIY